MIEKREENLFSIRPATPADYENIVALWRASGLSIRLTGRDRKEEFERQLRRFADCYLVAEVGGNLIGVVLGTHDERKGWINRLAVLPQHRGRGVATALIYACEAALHQIGIEIIAALVEPDNEASMKFFERLDYKTDVPVQYFRKLRRDDV